jgi:isocitrate dehydrogenase
MTHPTPITVAHGDGIGPDIMTAVLRVLDAAGAKLAIETIEIGRSVYERGVTSGIEPSAWESLRRTQVFLKAPITTPQGGGYKSLNVTVRKALGLYANVRPCVSYHPFVQTKHPNMDVVIIRENEEDVYAGVEYQQTAQMTQCLKFISRPGTERLVRYAFEYARRAHRKKITCCTKDNIMKMTDGLFHKVFDEIATQYPDIQTDHWIIDIGAAKLADTPERFDVMVLPNLYGDILSDIAAEIVGSVGLAGTANIGEQCAMFEAIHGSAPDIAGKNIANPSGLLLSSVMMLVHIGQLEVAEKVQNAWLRTIEDGVHTPDLYDRATSREKVGTSEFADAVIRRLGQEPQRLGVARFASADRVSITPPKREAPAPKRKALVGVDVYVDWSQGSAEQLANLLQAHVPEALTLSTLSNRGLKVWPDETSSAFVVDHWAARVMSRSQGEVTHGALIELLTRLHAAGIDVIKTENLYTFDGKPGYTLGQGQ